MATIGPWLVAWVATMNAAMERDGPDRQVDAAGQHRQGLAAGEDRQRDRRADRETDPGGLDGPRLDELEDHDQDDEQRCQRDERPIAEQASLSVGERLRTLGLDRLGAGAVIAGPAASR